MGAALGTMFGVERTERGVKGFRKKKVGGSTFYVAECVAFTSEQLGFGARSASAPRTRAADKKSTPRWNGGVVPYRFIGAFSKNEKRFLEKAAKMWQDATGVVSFVEDKDKTQATFVRVSKISKQQNIASNGAVADAHIQIGFFNVGSIAHELGHVLGLVHEHQRADRDDFVTVGTDVSGNANFRLHEPSEDELRTDYDFESIMHYGEKVTLNGAAVVALTPKPAFKQFKSKMGQRARISAKDKDAIVAMYGP